MGYFNAMEELGVEFFDESGNHRPKNDIVNSPSHYKEEGKIECIDYMRERLTAEQFKGYLLGNVHKYTHRWQYKNGKEDLEKAQWYLNKLIGEEV